jgi:DNA-binding SARP family transcriptional activator
MIRLSVLGPIRVWTDEGAQLNRVVAGDHRTVLLAYLALSQPALRRRESIMALLWPDHASGPARHSLRQLLHVLREELSADVLVTVGDEYVGVNAARLWCDAVAFRQAVGECAYERALELYGGPFCDGVSVLGSPECDRWLEQTRLELHELVADAARRLAHRCEAEGNAADAVRWGRRALRLAPGDERLLRWVVEVSERDGGTAAALRIYREYVRTMRTEYEIGPSEETAALMRRMRTRHRLTR